MQADGYHSWGKYSRKEDTVGDDSASILPRTLGAGGQPSAVVAYKQEVLRMSYQFPPDVEKLVQEQMTARLRLAG